MNPYAIHGGSASLTVDSVFQVFPESEKVKPDSTGVNSSHGDCQNTDILRSGSLARVGGQCQRLSVNEKGVARFRQK